jgi:hypothetical protein
MLAIWICLEVPGHQTVCGANRVALNIRSVEPRKPIGWPLGVLLGVERKGIRRFASHSIPC